MRSEFAKLLFQKVFLLRVPMRGQLQMSTDFLWIVLGPWDLWISGLAATHRNSHEAPFESSYARSKAWKSALAG